MKYNDAQIVSALNDLLTRNYDAVAGYREAANGAKRLALKKWMWDNMEMRERFIKDLKNAIVRLGAEPEEGASFLSELHRIWIDLKSDATEKEGLAVLEECRVGEARALEDYRQVIDNIPMPDRFCNILRRHHEQIENTVGQLEVLIPVLERKET